MSRSLEERSKPIATAVPKGTDALLKVLLAEQEKTNALLKELVSLARLQVRLILLESDFILTLVEWCSRARLGR